MTMQSLSSSHIFSAQATAVESMNPFAAFAFLSQHLPTTWARPQIDAALTGHVSATATHCRFNTARRSYILFSFRLGLRLWRRHWCHWRSWSRRWSWKRWRTQWESQLIWLGCDRLWVICSCMTSISILILLLSLLQMIHAIAITHGSEIFGNSPTTVLQLCHHDP